MSQGTMAWWRLRSVFFLVAAAAFATAASEIWESMDTFPDLKLEDKAMSGKWESVPELQDEAVSGKWVDLYDSKDRRQASDDYDEDDYSDGIAQVGEEYSIKNALKPRSGQKLKCPFTPSPEDVSTTPQTVTVVPEVLPPRVLVERRPMSPSRPISPPRPVSFPFAPPVSSTGAQNCAVRLGLRVACGSVTISRTACLAAGCCFESTCFYPMTPPHPMMPVLVERRPMMPLRPTVSIPVVTLSVPLPPAPPVSSTGAQNCAVRLGLRVACGSVTISRTACLAAGCCFESTCFYPMTPPHPMMPVLVERRPMMPLRPTVSIPVVTLSVPLPPAPPVSSTGAQNCAVRLGLRVACGSVTISRTACLAAGCCFESTCFYPMTPPHPMMPVLVERRPMSPSRPISPPRPTVSIPFVTSSVPLPPAPPVSSTGAQNCVVRLGQRVACGSVTISRTACLEAGCCFESTCFYPMNECTKDEHFVFAINRDSPKRDSVDPTGLVIPSDRACRPVIVDRMYAIFKFSIHECGTHHYEVGGTNVYLAEVFTPITTMSLKYGVITRSKFVRFLFECRYDVDGPVSHTSLFSIGYMVRTPFSSFPSQIISDGLFAIQLRIAREPTFTSWVDDHLPLRQLVNGEPVYLEVRLRSPKPKAVLLVNYCIAYTRYATNALVIIYEGCENPLDDTVAILRVTEANRYTRRFKVDAFQFMDLRTSKFIDEDIYFMCSTELCMPLERECEQQCFDGQQRPLTGTAKTGTAKTGTAKKG